MNEKIYKTMASSGAGSLALGIVVLVTGLVTGILMIVNGARPVSYTHLDVYKRQEYVPVICEQLYDLAMMSHKQLSPEEMTKFVKRSNDILMVLTK